MKKNKIFKSLENDIPFVPDYSTIQDKIQIDQYTKKELKEKKYILKFTFVSIITILIFVAAATFGISYKIKEPKIKYVEQSNVQIFNHDKEFVDNYENIFVGKVLEEVQVKQYDGTGMDIPYTFYKVEQIYILKGNKNYDNNLLCFYGGYKNQMEIELLKNNDELVEKEQYYLFFVNINKDNSSTRIGLNDYIISNNNQKILLENYDVDKELINQNQNVLTIVNRYNNVINKNLANEKLDIKEYKDKKEIYDAFTFVSIIRVRDFVPFNTNGEGIYSEIVSSYYKVEVLKNFKNNVDDITKNLYCYGTNFWDNVYKDSHCVDVLKNDSVYLLLANECSDNENNTRIKIGDFVIMSNYQLVELKDYQIEKSYEKQNNIIKEIIDEYMK